MPKQIIDGYKNGKAVSARWVKPKENWGIDFIFRFEEPSTGLVEVLNWTAWMSANAVERSVDTLTNVLGWNGNECFDVENPGKDFPKQTLCQDPKSSDFQKLSNTFDWDREVSLTVKHEKYMKDGVEKESVKISFVNPLGGSAYQACSPELVKSEIPRLGLRAHFLAAKQNGPMPPAKKKDVLTDDQVPF